MNDDRVFLDSNVLVYLYSDDDGRKRDRALNFMAEKDCFTGVNNIGETITVLTRKFGKRWSHLQTFLTEVSQTIAIVSFDFDAVVSAVRIMDRYGFSYYDSLVVALALENECSTLYTEDLQHGQVIDGKLTVTDIFA